MCCECCREFKGWCRSFTRAELLLALLQLIFLILFIGFLVFLVLHLIVCSDRKTNFDMIIDMAEATTLPTTENFSLPNSTTYKATSERNILTSKVATSKSKHTTFNKTLQCTWSPSSKTKAPTRFYEILSISYKVDATTDKVFQSTDPYIEYFDSNKNEAPDNTNLVSIQQLDDMANLIGDNRTGSISSNVELVDSVEELSSESDGEDVSQEELTVVLALVKIKPPTDVTFGCILTIITKHWTLTAASCIESIEEMDTLDVFVMMEDYGSVKKGRTHAVSDVQIHPLYEGVNRSYDLTAIKTESNLLKRSAQVELPSILDHLQITIGERFHIFGYGPFRTVDKGPNGKRLRKVPVYSLPSKQCPEESETWALRHLWAGEEVPQMTCGLVPLCAGVRYARGITCNYCAGTPLLVGAMLYGVMSEGHQCGVACEPQLYVSVALVRDWIDTFLGD